MELRLFVIACIMYAFVLVTRCLDRTDILKSVKAFSKWYAVYLVCILTSAWYLYLFVSCGGTGGVFPLFKMAAGLLVIIGFSIYQFFKVSKSSAEKLDSLKKSALDWCNTVYFAGFVSSLIMFFFIQAFKIPSASMNDTLLEGDHLFVNKAVYGFRLPFTNKHISPFKTIQSEDIVIFQFPVKNRKQENCGGSQYGRDFVKRVIAMPGDVVEVRDAHVYVNGKELPRQPYEKYDAVERIHFEDDMPQETYQHLWEDHLLDSVYGVYLRDQFGPVTVPPNSYFVMGDNRDNSCDSRFWGPVPRENIKGKAWFIHWPLNRMRVID